MSPINWCRLCARVESIDDSILNPFKEINEMVKNFINNFSLSTYEMMPLIVCDDCHNSVDIFRGFYETCLRANKMFMEIRSCNGDKTIAYLKDIRQKYGFELKTELLQPFPESELIILQKTKRPEESIFKDPLIKDEPMDEEVGHHEAVIVIEPKVEQIVATKMITRKSKIKDIFSFDCHICPEKFSTFGQIRKHCTVAHKKAPRILCVCGITITHANTIVRHRKKHSSESTADQLFCKTCNLKFTGKRVFDRHNQDVHGLPTTFTFICSECNRHFSSSSYLKAHHQKVHAENFETNSMISCTKCDKKLKGSHNLTQHMRYMHSDKKKSFVCEECGRSCRSKGILLAHIRTHTEDRPYPCTECPKTFKTAATLNVHMDCHSAETHECTICRTTFNTKFMLRSHMVVHVQENEKKYSCNHCGLKYKRSQEFKNHLLSHIGIESYRCQFCDRTFFSGSNCRKHKKRVHADELAAFEAAGGKVSMANLPKMKYLNQS